MESNFAFFYTKQIWWIRKRNVTNRFDLSDTPVTTCRPAGLLFADEYTVNQRRGNAASTSCRMHTTSATSPSPYVFTTRPKTHLTIIPFVILDNRGDNANAYWLSLSVCVCLSANKITPKVSGEFGRNFLGR